MACSWARSNGVKRDLYEGGHKLPPNAAVDSHNLLPLLEGKSGAVREALVHNTREKTYAIRHGEWLLVDSKTGYMSPRNPEWEARHAYTADDTQPVQLYNLQADLVQKENLAAKHPEKVDEIQRVLGQIRKQGHSAPRLQTQKN